jgi:hypothetical protein
VGPKRRGGVEATKESPTIIPALLLEGVIGGSVLSLVAFLLSRFVWDVVGWSSSPSC